MANLHQRQHTVRDNDCVTTAESTSERGHHCSTAALVYTHTHTHMDRCMYIPYTRSEVHALVCNLWTQRCTTPLTQTPNPYVNDRQSSSSVEGRGCVHTLSSATCRRSCCQGAAVWNLLSSGGPDFPAAARQKQHEPHYSNTASGNDL